MTDETSAARPGQPATQATIEEESSGKEKTGALREKSGSEKSGLDMFETTVVESRKRKVGISRLLTLPVSIGLHVIVILAVIISAIWTVQFPTNSPAQVAQYSIAASPPPPPPPPPPDERPREFETEVEWRGRDPDWEHKGKER